jgi:aryl-alcohol dehydrogenase-like predicted oxidoreductase
VSSVLLGASKLQQLEDNLGAMNVELTGDELSELDAATPLAKVYPNWFMENMSDRATQDALAH